MIACEKDIEDQLEKLAPLVVGVENARCVGRQVTLPSGRRIDLLYAHVDPAGERVWTVVEVKYREADVSALVQLIGYMDELRGGMALAAQKIIRVQGVLAAPRFSGDAWTLSEYLRPDIEMCLLEPRIEMTPCGRDPVVVPQASPGFERVPELLGALEVRHERMDRAIERAPAELLIAVGDEMRARVAHRVATDHADRDLP